MNEALRTILVVEDEEVLRESMADYLEDRDYRVLKAEDGRVGIELFEQEQPDLVLTDLRMPGVDGLEVLSRIGQLSPETPVVVVSGTGRIADIIQALRLGAWDYILKPVEDLSIITHAVNRALERARLINENREHQENLELLVKQRTTELERATEDIKASEARFRDLAEMLPEAVFETDKDFNLTYINQRTVDLFGYSDGDIRKGLNAVEGIALIDRDRAMENIARSLRLERLGAVEYKALRKDGSTFPTLININPIMNGQEIMGFRGVVFDLTERKKVAEERARLQEQLFQSQKMEAIGTLAGGIAHDFNNILVGIMGYTELALKAAQRGEVVPDKLEQILKSSERAKGLVKQILTFGRKTKYEFKSLDLKQEITNVLNIIKSTIPKMIAVELRLPGDSQRIVGDSAQIEQVILNLCTNAKDAMPEGGRLTVETESVSLTSEYAHKHLGVPPGEYVQVTVSDTGKGMDKETLDHIFEPFYTTKEVGKGTGLGLAMVYGVVKSHGGGISCDSQPDVGTTFKVYLPLLESDEDSDESRLPDDGLIPGGEETILLVDDEEVIRDIGREFLVGSGYNAITAPDGETALKIYRKRGAEIDLVILDISMPGMGGLKCHRELLGLNRDIKVIIASGYSQKEQKENSNQPDATGYISKPFKMKDLLKMVRQALDN